MGKELSEFLNKVAENNLKLCHDYLDKVKDKAVSLPIMRDVL